MSDNMWDRTYVDCARNGRLFIHSTVKNLDIHVDGRTALTAVTRDSNHVLLRILLDHGADPRKRIDSHGRTALHLEVALEGADPRSAPGCQEVADAASARDAALQLAIKGEMRGKTPSVAAALVRADAAHKEARDLLRNLKDPIPFLREGLLQKRKHLILIGVMGIGRKAELEAACGVAAAKLDAARAGVQRAIEKQRTYCIDTVLYSSNCR